MQVKTRALPPSTACRARAASVPCLCRPSLSALRVRCTPESIFRRVPQAYKPAHAVAGWEAGGGLQEAARRSASIVGSMADGGEFPTPSRVELTSVVKSSHPTFISTKRWSADDLPAPDLKRDAAGAVQSNMTLTRCSSGASSEGDCIWHDPNAMEGACENGPAGGMDGITEVASRQLRIDETDSSACGDVDRIAAEVHLRWSLPANPAAEAARVSDTSRVVAAADSSSPAVREGCYEQQC